MSRLLEKYKINISVYGYSLIQGTRSRFLPNLKSKLNQIKKTIKIKKINQPNIKDRNIMKCFNKSPTFPQHSCNHKHCKIAKCCLEFISSVVKVSSCSYQNIVLGFVRNLVDRMIFELCHNLSLRFVAI